MHAVVADVDVLRRAHAPGCATRPAPTSTRRDAASSCVRSPVGVDALQAVVADLPAGRAPAASAPGCRAARLPVFLTVICAMRSLPCGKLRDVHRLAVGVAVAHVDRQAVRRRILLAAARRRRARGRRRTACDPRCSCSVERQARGRRRGQLRGSRRGASPVDRASRALAGGVVEAEALERLRARVLRHRHQREGHATACCTSRRPTSCAEMSSSSALASASRPSSVRPMSTTARSRSSEPNVYGLRLGEHERLQRVRLRPARSPRPACPRACTRTPASSARRPTRDAVSRRRFIAPISGWPGERQRVQPVRLRVARGLDATPALILARPFVAVFGFQRCAALLLVAQPRGLHVAGQRVARLLGFEHEVAGVGRAPVVAPVERRVRVPDARPVGEAAAGCCMAAQPRDARAHVVLDLPAAGSGRA